MGIEDMVLTLVRFGLLLFLIYGILAAVGYLFALVVKWLHEMFRVIWYSPSGPYVVLTMLIGGGIWVLWKVFNTPVVAFWK